MSDVGSTAGAIRRRRRTFVVLAAAAVVVAVVVPTAFLMDRDPSSTPLPGTDLPTSASTGTAPRIRLGALPEREPPGIAYLEGNVFVSAEGTRTSIPLDRVTNATPYGGGFLVSVTGPDLGPRVVLLDNRMHEVWRRCGQGGSPIGSSDNFCWPGVVYGVNADQGDEMLGTRPTAVLATATVAVALGVLAGAVVLLRDDDQGPLQRGPVAVTPSGPASSAPSPDPATVLDELPRGTAPAIGYVDDHVYVAPGGRRTALPRDRGISAVTPLGERLLVADTRIFEGSIGLALVDRTGARIDEWCSSGAPVVSADRHLTAWVTFPCLESLETGATKVHRARTDRPGAGRTSQHVGRRAPITVVGFLGDDIVVDGAWEERGYLTDLVSAPRPIAGLTWVRSVDEFGGLVAGQLGPDGKFGAVLDPRTGEIRWQAPSLHLGEFSPDGSLIVGQHQDSWSLFDRTGSVAFDLAVPEGGDVSSMAWEDERHLLAVVTTGSQIALIRFDAHGAAALAAPPVPYDPNDPAYVLAARS